MGVAIYLLGSPRVERDGLAVAAPRGRKVWALLAYLLLSESPPLRAQLARLLFAEADDPLRALRWNLNALRQLLGDAATVERDPVALQLQPGTFVDVLALTEGTWVEASTLLSLEAELLADMDFSAAGTFETWLLNERRRLQAAAATVLTEAVLARLALGDADGAVGLAARLVALDPLVEDHHALLVRSFMAAGDDTAAERQVAACRELFRQELGIRPTLDLSDADDAPPFSAPAARGAAAVRAQIDVGEAALRAGAADVGLEYLKRAAAESRALGGTELESRALLLFGSGLVHASRGRQLEGVAALHRVLVMAEDEGNEELAAAVHHHLAWVDVMAARFGPMHRKLDRAATLRVDDERVRLWGDLTRGLGYLSTAHYSDAEAVLRKLVMTARSTRETGFASFGLSILSGVFSHRGEFQAARQAASEALDAARSTGVPALSALAEAKLARAELNDGSRERGRQLAEHALAVAQQIEETPAQVAAATELGLLEFADGDLDRAVAHLGAAWSRPMLLPDFVWKGAMALDALCSVAVSERLPEARRWVADLEAVASRGGLRELLVHAYLHRHRLGDDTGEAAVMLAAQIDNPALHDLVSETTGARLPVSRQEVARVSA